jgi:hypothetical protein
MARLARSCTTPRVEPTKPPPLAAPCTAALAAAALPLCTAWLAASPPSASAWLAALRSALASVLPANRPVTPFNRLPMAPRPAAIVNGSIFSAAADSGYRLGRRAAAPARPWL